MGGFVSGGGKIYPGETESIRAAAGDSLRSMDEHSTCAYLDTSHTLQVSFSAWENTSKNEGPTHDVIENTTPCSKTASRTPMFMKTNDLRFYPTML
jgi:hypothetical protein